MLRHLSSHTYNPEPVQRLTGAHGSLPRELDFQGSAFAGGRFGREIFACVEERAFIRHLLGI